MKWRVSTWRRYIAPGDILQAEVVIMPLICRRSDIALALITGLCLANVGHAWRRENRDAASLELQCVNKKAVAGAKAMAARPS